MVFLARLYFSRWITVPQLVNAFYVITKNEIGEYEISQSKNTVTCSSVPSFVVGLRMRTSSFNHWFPSHDEETMTKGL